MSDYRPPSKTARRILRHYHSGISYFTLLRLVFPDEASHRPSSNGGPPGCAIAFGRALRELAAWVSCDSARRVTIYTGRIVDAGDGVERHLNTLIGQPVWFWGWIYRITGWDDYFSCLVIEHRIWDRLSHCRRDDYGRPCQESWGETTCVLGLPEDHPHHARLLFDDRSGAVDATDIDDGGSRKE